MLNKKNRKIRQKVIRLRRRGELYYPLYDIVVTYRDNRSRGSFIEKIGFLNPHPNERTLYINSERLAFWTLKGVYVNSSVKRYLVKFLVT